MPVGPFGKEESLFAEREGRAITEVATLGKQKGRHAIAVPFFVSARGQAVSGPDPAARHPSPSLLPPPPLHTKDYKSGRRRGTNQLLMSFIAAHH